MKGLLLALATVLATMGNLVSEDAFASRVSKQLEGIFSDAAFVRGLWGVKVKSLRTGEVLFERNPYHYVMPASNMKLVTAAAAHARLGLDFRFRTTLATDGPARGGALKGNLIVIGGGDPTLGARLSSPDPEDSTKGDPLLIFKQWAARLKREGIKRIEGDILGDASFFEDVPLGEGWSWDDIGYGYSAQISALQYNDNSVLVRIYPGAESGEPAGFDLNPPTSYLRIENRMTTVGPEGDLDVEIRREPGTNRVQLVGTVPVGRTPFWSSAAVHDPALFFVTVLKETLEAEGIEVGGEARRLEQDPDRVQPHRETLFVHESPDLRYVLKVLLKVSQNLYAETLVRLLDPVPSGKSYDRGRERVIAVLTRMGIPPESYILADGSGLSRYNYLSADMLIRLLESVWRHPERNEFLEFLPVAGGDGTLENRMKGTSAQGNVRAKTGTLRNVRALAGYVKTGDGEPLAFVMIANNFQQPMKSAEYLQDSALILLSALKR